MARRSKQAIPEFRGAPTWEGRLIVGIFGGLWVFFGLFGMIFSLATETGLDLIAPLYGSGLFLAVGLAILTLAFPKLVNRALQSKNRLLLALWPYRGNLFAGGLFAGMGLFPVLAAAGLIPVADIDAHAPRWVVAIAGGMFLAVGIYILAGPWVERQSPQLRKQLLGLLPLLIFTGFAVIADWIAFGPGQRDFGTTAGNGWLSVFQGGDAQVGRIVFGLSGIVLTLASLLGWWRYLRGQW